LGIDRNFILSGQFIDKNDVFVEALMVDFTKQTNIESSALTSGQSYYLRVTGTYGVTSSDSADAAYSYDEGSHVWNLDHTLKDHSSENYMAWTWNGLSSQRPSPDVYNVHHVYYYYFTGDGTTENFSFSDSAYGDNKGSLKIEIWENK